MNRLPGKWALITGASRGIGQQIAIGLAQEGCNLILHARGLDHLKKTRDLLAGSSVEQLLVAGDSAFFVWTLTGTNTGPGGTGRSVRVSGIEVWKMGESGLIESSRGYYDADAYQRQITGEG